MAVKDLPIEPKMDRCAFVLEVCAVIGLRGDRDAINEWAPRLRQHRAAVLREVAAARLAGLHRIWIIRPPLRTAFTVACPQGATEAKIEFGSVWRRRRAAEIATGDTKDELNGGADALRSHRHYKFSPRGRASLNWPTMLTMTPRRRVRPTILAPELAAYRVLSATDTKVGQ